MLSGLEEYSRKMQPYAHPVLKKSRTTPMVDELVARFLLLVFRQIRWVRLRRKQQLNPKVANEMRLVTAGSFQAASCHEKQDNGAMDFIATAKVDRGLVDRRME
jgi:hypothetical protein